MTGLNPADRCNAGTKRHLVVDAHGTPLGVVSAGAKLPRKPRAGSIPRRSTGPPNRPPRSSAPEAGQIARRQSLRSPPLPARMLGAEHHPAHRPPRRRERPPPRTTSLDGRAYPATWHESIPRGGPPFRSLGRTTVQRAGHFYLEVPAPAAAVRARLGRRVRPQRQGGLRLNK